jgi:hypothetical protein
MMKRIVALLLLAFFVCGCATTAQFSRVGGIKKTDFHGIRVYGGPVPVDAQYKNLGEISVEVSGPTILVRLNRGLEEITIKARDLGANAIINWHMTAKFPFATIHSGEAVIFDKFPVAVNDKYFVDK